jgi:hypothetical protein
MLVKLLQETPTSKRQSQKSIPTAIMIFLPISGEIYPTKKHGIISSEYKIEDRNIKTGQDIDEFSLKSS